MLPLRTHRSGVVLMRLGLFSMKTTDFLRSESNGLFSSFQGAITNTVKSLQTRGNPHWDTQPLNRQAPRSNLEY